MALTDTDKEKEIRKVAFIESKGQLLPVLSSLASVESLSRPPVQEVILSADIRCVKCQKRVAEIMSRMNEIESVVVNLSEKKVILTCRYSDSTKSSLRQVALYKNPPGKVAMFKRMFSSSKKSIYS